MNSTASSSATTLRDLRRWHVGSAAAAALPPGALPVLLLPFRDPSRVRHDYPLLVHGAGGDVAAVPLGDVLHGLLDRATAQGRVAQDNLKRLERRLRVGLGAAVAADARTALKDAIDPLLADLQLAAPVADGLRADLLAMATAMPQGELLALAPTTALRLFAAAGKAHVQAARAALSTRIEAAAKALRDLLAVEAQKDPAAREANAVQKSLGAAMERFVDPSALARSLGQHRGTQRTDEARLARLKEALATLGATAEEAPYALLFCHGAPPTVPGALCQTSDHAVAAATAQFDARAGKLLAIVRALRIADLERQNAYEPERHDPLLAGLDWRDLGADELATLPVTIAVLRARELAVAELPTITHLLASGRPVQVVVLENPACDPVLGADAAQARLELGYLGIAFREAYVQQSTAARPTHLLRGYRRALASGRAGLHVIDSGLDAEDHEGPLGAFLHASAAIDGRAHPLFQYDPEAGETWARRLDFSGNPSPDADWPTSDTEAFTFADYALLQPHLQRWFTPIAADASDADLVPMAEHLQLPPEEARRRIPFVRFATPADPKPVRAAVHRALAVACRDRLRFWRTLQELAGVRNEYVREAVQRARQEAAEQAERERTALAERHGAELAQVRAEATDVAMQGLARMLLEIDPIATVEAPSRPAKAAVAPAPAPAATPAAAPAAPPAAPTAAPAAAAADDDDGEPWIDSPRCSTCNDCVNLNSLLFVYNENKQARIGDASKGTYAQLVTAAEKCPSRCIHPGKPLNPAEPGLEALIARAAPFRA